MSMNLAAIHLTGNIANRPEMKHNSESISMATFRLAVNHRYVDKNGEWQSAEPMFLTVQCWGKLAKNIVSDGYVGMPVLVIGRMYQSSWSRKRDDGGDDKFTALRVRASHVGPDMGVVSVQAYREEKQGIDAGDAEKQDDERGNDRVVSFAATDVSDAKNEGSEDRELVGSGAQAGAEPPF